MAKTFKRTVWNHARGMAALCGRFFLSLFVPPVCVHCRRPRWRETPLCRSCSRELADARRPDVPTVIAPAMPLHSPDKYGDSENLHFLFRKTPALSTLIHGFKYRHLERHIRYLCAHVRYREDLRTLLESVDLLVPVPIHHSRRRERGYNQAEKIAWELSALTGVPVGDRTLRRIRQTTSQTRLGKGDRTTNLRHALALGRKKRTTGTADRLFGKRVLLIDDVFTTGATAEACAELLRQAGCVSIKFFALAKVDVDPDRNDFLLELESASAYLA